MTGAGSRVRAAVTTLHSLSQRGRYFLAAGLGCALGALLVGQPALLEVAGLLVALPLVSAAVVARTRYRLGCGRRLSSTRVPVGGRVRVTLTLDNLARLPTAALLMEDTLPVVFNGRPRFSVPRMAAGSRREVAYAMRCELRGRYSIGPLVVRVTDPFGCCELARSFTSGDQLVVTPAITPLPAVPLGGAWAGGREGAARSATAAGEADATVREYRRGDDLRMVHWRSTARTGELMVRREEQPWQSRATVLLDDRAGAHRGQGPASSFEWAVSAAASVGVQAARRGFGVRLVTASGRDIGADSPALAEVTLLDELAVAALHPVSSLARAVALLRGESAPGQLVAVLGSVDVSEARLVARLAGRGRGLVALLVDAASWTGTSPAGKEAAEQALQTSRALLGVAGWRVLVARPGDDLALVWEELARHRTGSPAAAHRWAP
ncbi:MAG: DUF58 domain-containing protein [Mycobacteriales bacterium]